MQLFDRLCEQGGADEHNDRQSKLDDDETLANPKLRDDIFAFERAGHSRPERARGVVRVNVESGSERGVQPEQLRVAISCRLRLNAATQSSTVALRSRSENRAAVKRSRS